MEGETGAKTVAEVIEADVVATEANFCRVGGKQRADRQRAERVFDDAAKEEEIRAAIAIVRVAGKDRCAIQIGAADCGGEVEGDLAVLACKGFGNERPQTNRPFKFPSEGDRGARHRLVLAACASAVIGSVVWKNRCGTVAVVFADCFREVGERDVVIEIEIEAAERISAVSRCKELLELEEVIEADSVEESGDETDGFGGLEVCGLLGEAGSG